jgi:hypothetical protein
MGDMPKIWSQTIEAHRDAVREATINATAVLVAKHLVTPRALSERRSAGCWCRRPAR